MKDNRGSSIQTASNEVVLSVLSEGSDSSSDSFGIKIENKEPNDSAIASSKREYYAQNTDMPPEVPKFSPASFTRRRPVITRAFSKSKSRFIEPTYPSEPDLAFQSNQGVLNALPRASMHTLKPTSIVPNTALADLERDEEDDFEDVYISNILRANHVPGYLQKTSVFTLVELFVFLSLTGLLVASLIDYDLQETSIWNLVLWKWCVLFIVAFSGRLITEWIIELIVCLVKRRLFFKKKVRYFVYGVKNSLQICIWLGFVLVAWILLVIRGSKRSSKTTRVLHYITFGIAGCLVGAGIWLIKTLLIKILGVSFHVKRFFDRIQESLFNQYVLHTLSGPPLMEKRVARSINCSRLSLERKTKDKRVKQDVINVEKLQKMNQEKVSAWTMKGLIKVTRRSNLSTMSNTLDLNEGDEIVEKNNEIKSEREAKLAAVKIFHRVAKPGYAFIEEEDLLRFMNVDEVSQAFPLFDGAIETGKITKSSLNKWVVNAYMERKSLAHSLNDTKTVVDELNSLASVLVTIVIVIVWNLIMGFLTTKILLFLISQLLLLAFVFGNSVKTIFEAIIFIFVMHPFDVGDRCVIDGVQMVVEEMNILTTIFLRYDNEKISYPNSVLANKPISNFYRSPEMIDSVEFAIDFATKVEHIAGLKERIESYIESKPQHWKPSHSVQLKEIVDMNKIVMTLYVTHTINFQNIVEKGNRRSDLVLELKKIFEELGIKYHLLPQDIHVKYVGSLAAAAIAQS